MRIKIEIAEDLSEDEVIIRCRKMDDSVRRVYEAVQNSAFSSPRLTFYNENTEFYFPLENILFFETGGENVYAHTTGDMYRIKLRLYELEKVLPRDFVRISKSTIVNVPHILSVHRNLASSSLIQFHKSHKQVYASRLYYEHLRQRLHERSFSHED